MDIFPRLPALGSTCLTGFSIGLFGHVCCNQLIIVDHVECQTRAKEGLLETFLLSTSWVMIKILEKQAWQKMCERFTLIWTFEKLHTPRMPKALGYFESNPLLGCSLLVPRKGWSPLRRSPSVGYGHWFVDTSNKPTSTNKCGWM